MRCAGVVLVAVVCLFVLLRLVFYSALFAFWFVVSGVTVGFGWG